MYYLRYFIYIAVNWNLKVAWFTIKHEMRGERKYGLNTSKIADIKKFSKPGVNIEHAENYQGANYYLLEEVFAFIQNITAEEETKNFPGKIRSVNNLLDYGCGKGRVLAVASCFDFKKITGIDFVNELCKAARKNIIPFQQEFPEKIFNVIKTDAVDYVIENDTNTFFFFNPFDEIVMQAVVKNILLSLKNNPREVYVIYINPVHKEIFLSAGFEQIYHLEKLHYIQVSVFIKSVEDDIHIGSV
ncbi:MAG: methyltransferase domain-containing protein [Chitinophagaceae bacterium]|nr:methyltransferase domain-containing protein [Chitinophagaceae bacterium]